LAGHDFSWAEADRQRFRTLWLQQALQVGEHDLAAGNYATAVALYTALQMRHRDAEQAYFGLMQAYAAQGHRAGVHAQYTTLVDMMEREFALPPARHISGWYERWQQASGTQPSGKPTSGT
jgi:two-component SAPR family response regulator